jgi:hypothetical protein
MKVEKILSVNTSGENAPIHKCANMTYDSPRAGGCRASSCSCTSFVVKDRHNAQWCENCGHNRNQH